MRKQGRVVVQDEAERLEKVYTLLTAAQVAARLSPELDAETVRSWIEDDKLDAYDCRRRGAKRPRWMVEWEAVEAFLESQKRRAAA